MDLSLALAFKLRLDALVDEYDDFKASKNQSLYLIAANDIAVRLAAPCIIAFLFRSGIVSGLILLAKAFIGSESFKGNRSVYGDIVILKPRVWLMVHLSHKRIYKCYNHEAPGESDLSKVSRNHFDAMQVSAELTNLQKLIPETDVFHQNMHKGVSLFRSRYYDFSPPSVRRWQEECFPQILPTLFEYYAEKGITDINWKFEERLESHLLDLNEFLNKLGAGGDQPVTEAQVMVHGDLQHYNALVQDQEIKIIDWGGYRRSIFSDLVYQWKFYGKWSENLVDLHSQIRKNNISIQYFDLVKEIAPDIDLNRQLAISIFRTHHNLFFNEE